VRKICQAVGADTRLGSADEPSGSATGMTVQSVLQLFRTATVNAHRRVLSLNMLLAPMQESNLRG